ncbi:MAG: hypothetical protein MHMPM18_003863, partial [Marteilia pararefringens]
MNVINIFPRDRQKASALNAFQSSFTNVIESIINCYNSKRRIGDGLDSIHLQYLPKLLLILFLITYTKDYFGNDESHLKCKSPSEYLAIGRNIVNLKCFMSDLYYKENHYNALYTYKSDPDEITSADREFYKFNFIYLIRAAPLFIAVSLLMIDRIFNHICFRKLDIAFDSIDFTLKEDVKLFYRFSKRNEFVRHCRQPLITHRDKAEYIVFMELIDNLRSNSIYLLQKN